MVNRKNIDLLIKHLQTIDPSKFDMKLADSFGRGKCICGHAYDLFGLEGCERDFELKDRLGVDEHQIYEIMFPRSIGWDRRNPYDATIDDAVQLLTILRDEGVVDWERVMG